MKHSSRCIALVKEFEEFRARPYLCKGKVWTIGYGTTFYPNGKKVSNSDKAITEVEASEYLNDYLLKVSRSIYQFSLENKLELNQNQFDALCSFSYNLGLAPILSSDRSLHQALKTKNPNLVSIAMKKYVFSDGVKLQGLVNRRELESQVYLESL